MEKPVLVAELFRDELRKGVPIAALNRTQVSYSELDPMEVEVVNKVFDDMVNHLRKVSPKIASDIEAQRSLAVKVAGIAKATFPVRKSYQFPSVPGSLGVAPLFPQAIKYATDVPTSYTNNSWDISLTEGTKAYILGSATAFYRTSSVSGKYSFILIFNNGLIEVNSTPGLEQFRIVSEGKQDYGAYAVEPLVDQPIEDFKTIYQYPTPLGALWIDHQSGLKWEVLPRVTQTSTIKLLGLVFYEHDFFADTKWIATPR